jgi:hypothetical protein
MIDKTETGIPVTRVEKTSEGYIAPNGMMLTPTEEWLESHGFCRYDKEKYRGRDDLGSEVFYYQNWPIMSFVRPDSSCLRIYPGREGVEIVSNGTVLLGGCWSSDRIAQLWKCITGRAI